MAESDIGDDEDPLVVLPLHDPHDRGIQAAQFSINVINILYPPKPILLGEWNSSELKESEAVKLKNQMIQDDLRPFQYENMFHCIVERWYIEPRCINNTLLTSGVDAPVLALTDEGEAKLRWKKGQSLLSLCGVLCCMMQVILFMNYVCVLIIYNI